MKETARTLIPLYLAAFVVLFCGISAVNSTVEDPQLTFLTTTLVALGVVSSLWMRVQGADQRIIVWMASGLVALLFVMQPFFRDLSRGLFVGVEQEGFSSSGIGIVLEWATVLFAFTLLTNYSLLFSVVPSMALIGLMSSENLNPEMVTYFMGFTLSTVFMMGYQAHLERNTPRTEEEESTSVSYRPYLVLSAAVVAGAFLIGHIASAPLKIVGRQVFSVAANTLPSASTAFLPLDLRGTDDTMSLSGQPPNLSNTEVMRVKPRMQTQAPQYWRGAVYEQYTGISWKTGFDFFDLEPNGPRREDPNAQKTFRLDANKFASKLREREIFNYDVNLMGFNNALYAAGEPQRFEGPMERISLSPQLAVRADWTPNALNYSAMSLISHATPEQLRSAPSWQEVDDSQGAISPGALIYPMRIQDDLTRVETRQRNVNVMLPSTVPPQIRQEAERLTQGRTTDYDRTLAIEQHLKQTYRYTLEPPLLPPDKDAASFFLFESRSGYCEQFANAMAVMLRTLDIPARVAVGYAPGDYDTARNEWVVRELDAHAWVEVFFPGYGWITFDPTGGVEPEQPGFSFSKIAGYITRFINSRQFLPTLVLVAILSVFGYALKTAAYDRYLRPYVEESLWRWRRAPDPRWAVEKNYRQLRKLVRKQGVPITPSQTPYEVREAFLAKVADRNGEVAVPVERMTELYTQAAYGGKELPPGSDQASEEWLEQIRAGLKSHGRR